MINTLLNDFNNNSEYKLTLDMLEQAIADHGTDCLNKGFIEVVEIEEGFSSIQCTQCSEEFTLIDSGDAERMGCCL